MAGIVRCLMRCAPMVWVPWDSLGSRFERGTTSALRTMFAGDAKVRAPLHLRFGSRRALKQRHAEPPAANFCVADLLRDDDARLGAPKSNPRRVSPSL